MRADITAEQLVEFFERMVQKLVEQGVPAERIADALSVMSVRAGVRYGVVGPKQAHGCGRAPSGRVRTRPPSILINGPRGLTGSSISLRSWRLQVQALPRSPAPTRTPSARGGHYV